MNWWSETAVLWLPVSHRPNPEDFETRPTPGSSGFFYLGLDAFEAIARDRPHQFEREPWIFLVDSQQILSPGEIDQLMDDWNEQMRAAADVSKVGASV